MIAYSVFVSLGMLVHAHQVLVLEERGGMALILPTRTLDSSAKSARAVVGEVADVDRTAAGWKVRTVWAADALQWVPVSWLSMRPGVCITAKTLATLRTAVRTVPNVPRYQESDRQKLALTTAPQNKERICV